MSASLSSEVGPADDVPLSIEPVLGWRVWRLTHEDGELRLQALAHPHTWTPKEATAALCARVPHEGAPLESCTCGYYAASSVENLAAANVFSRGVAVIGAIAMWGTVIEHGRGARSQYAYPARLRLVCSQCLEEGKVVDPVSVVPGTWLLPLCDRHWRSQGTGHLVAPEVQQELLATYEVELLPRPALPRIPHRKRVEITPAKVLTFIALAIIHVIRFVMYAVTALWFIGLALGIVGLAVGAIANVFTRPTPSPQALVSTVPVTLSSPERTYHVFGPHRRSPPVPPPPRIALRCGISHWSWIEFAPCSSPGATLLGFAVGTEPRGVARDCIPHADAYSYGKDWNVCWSAMPGTYVSPTATSPNPFPNARR